MSIIHIKEGLRMLRRSLHVRRHGFKKYGCSAEDICSQIVKDCWNGTYFQTSTGHFCQFYTRDFSWCVESLIALGYREEVKKTLEYALACFTKKGSITTSITPEGIAFDFPTYGVDSVASIAHALATLNNAELTRKYASLINKETKKMAIFLTDEGLIKPELHLSSIKDHDKRKSSCYDTCMLGLLSHSLERLNQQVADGGRQKAAGSSTYDDRRRTTGVERRTVASCQSPVAAPFDNPLKQYNYSALLLKKYRAGSYFLDDLSGHTHLSADAQVFPFWTGLINDRILFNKVIQSIRQEGLDTPLPLQYTKKRSPHNRIALARLVGDYEGRAAWAHIGMIYLQVLSRETRKDGRKTVDVGRKTIDVGSRRLVVRSRELAVGSTNSIASELQKQREVYRQLIEQNSTFLEVFDTTGKPFKTPLYITDEGMLWAANFLTLK